MQNETDEKINSKSIPDKKDWLWRYMDLAKFINLLSTSKLFIPVCSKFEDSREGHYADPHVANADAFMQKLGIPGVFGSVGVNLAEKNRIQSEQAKNLLISCWNMDIEESVALWNMYPAGNNGVAIRTNVDLLKKYVSLTFPNAQFDLVEYQKLGTTDDVDKLFFRKQLEYSFEKEYRAVIDIRREPLFTQDGPERAAMASLVLNGTGGYPININLTEFIHEVRVHYKAPKWVIDDLKILVEKFGLQSALVNRSKLHNFI